MIGGVIAAIMSLDRAIHCGLENSERWILLL